MSTQLARRDPSLLIAVANSYPGGDTRNSYLTSDAKLFLVIWGLVAATVGYKYGLGAGVATLFLPLAFDGNQK